LNEKCPVCEHNSILYGILASKQTKTLLVNRNANCLTSLTFYVVSDPSNPENEGQIKLFKFGKKIFDKITEAMNPEFADETPVNPFDLWEGANFKLKIRNVEGYRNYDKSEFADKSRSLMVMMTNLKNCGRKSSLLKEFTEKKHFKPYEQLKGRLDKVLGFEGVPALKSKAAETTSLIDDDVSTFDTSGSTTDDDLDYFRELAEKD
jgi:hypothetical protein